MLPIPLLQLCAYFLLGYFGISMIIPGMSFGDSFSTIFMPLYVDIPWWVFEKIHDFTFNDLRDMDLNGFVILLGMLICIVLSFALPIAWYLFITLNIVVGILFALPAPVRSALNSMMDVFAGGVGHSGADPIDIALGITTVEKADDAYIQAKAIRKELER